MVGEKETKEIDNPKRARLILPLVGDGCERTYLYTPRLSNEATGLEVVLRPVLGDEASAYFVGDPLTQMTRAAAYWERHGKGWNVGDGTGGVAAITAANFLRLPYPAQVWLADMLFGYGTVPSGADGNTEQWRTEKNSSGPSGS